MKAGMMRRSREKRVGSVTQSLNVAAEVQSLESRSLPTGTVTASLSGGHLTIGGDNLDNSISIDVRPEGVFLTGLQDADPTIFTKIKFGKMTSDGGDEVQLSETSDLKSLTILMRGGNDNVQINVAVLAASISGRVRINLGRGDDHGVLSFYGDTMKIGGNLEVDLENGDDCFIVDHGVLGDLEKNQTGDLVLEDLSFPIQVNGNIIILGRLGKDLIVLDGVAAKRSVTIDGGDQDDTLAVLASSVRGNLSVNGSGGADRVIVGGTALLGTTTIRGGSGDDLLLITETQAIGNVAIYLGSGNDKLKVIESVRTINTRVVFDGGTGTDALVSDAPDDPLFLSIRSFEDDDIAQSVVDDAFANILNSTLACIDMTAPAPVQ